MNRILQEMQSLHYKLSYAGRPAGEQYLSIEPGRGGAKVVLEAVVELPHPRTRQRWESDIEPTGFPGRYRERVDGSTSRSIEVVFSKQEGLAILSQGRESTTVPYITDAHDPLSIIFAVGELALEVGQIHQFAMVGGRAYVERLADETEDEKTLTVYRLRPGLSLIYFSAEGYPVKLTQQVGEHIFEAGLAEIEMGSVQRNLLETKTGRRMVIGEPGPGTRRPMAIGSAKPAETKTQPKEEKPDPRRRRRRGRYS
jgi:hypothetical protein